MYVIPKPPNNFEGVFFTLITIKNPSKSSINIQEFEYTLPIPDKIHSAYKHSNFTSFYAQKPEE